MFKKYKKYLFFIIFLLFLVSSLFSNIKILITEIAPQESGDKTDWIEFFVLEKGNLENVEVYEGKTLLKKFGNIELEKGDYFVLNLKSSQKDNTEKNEDGFYDFYSTDSGLVATKNQIQIVDSENNLLDQVFYENKVGSYEDAIFVENIKKGESISRKSDEKDIFKNTSSSKNDFEISNIQTKGFFNKQEEKPDDKINNEDTDEINENFKILINEVSPDNQEADWIEFFVASGEDSLKNISLYVGKSEIYKFFDKKVKEGEYFLLNFNNEDEKEPVEINGVWNFFIKNSGLVTTDSIIILKNKTKIIDTFCYSNNDGTFAKANQEVMFDLIKSGDWKTNNKNNDMKVEDISERDCFIWSTSFKSLKNRSISRKQDSFGKPIDTDGSMDFEVGKETKGEGKLVIEDTFLEKDFGIDFLNKTFSPYNDYKFNTIKIKYKNPKDTTLKIKIYDIRMRLIKILIETDEDGLNILEWNGKNDNNSVMPVGIYIFYYEFINKHHGEILKGKKVVVLGKRL